MYKIASWNVNSLRVRLPQVLQWIETHQPDVLSLQETKLIDENFPKEEIEQAGYQVIYSGQKTYNGVAILSRHPLEEVIIQIPNFDDEQKRVLSATVDGLRVINVYVPNGASPDSDKFIYKLNWLDALENYLKQQLKQYDKLLIMGDFNIAPEDKDVCDPEAWEGHVLVTPAEREAFQRLCNLGLKDSFRCFEQKPEIYSWWDYRTRAFKGNRGLRIDHVLISDALVKQCRSSEIDAEPRGWERPTDHAPVFVTLDL